MSVMSQPLVVTIAAALSLIALIGAIYVTAVLYHLMFGTIGGNL